VTDREQNLAQFHYYVACRLGGGVGGGKMPASSLPVFGQVCVWTSVEYLLTVVEGESFVTRGLFLA
jgi:hypothetical protein